MSGVATRRLVQVAALCAVLLGSVFLLQPRLPGLRAAPSDRRAYRKAHRAYDGGPPTIPHPVTALGRSECLRCHEQGLRLQDGTLAPQTPHPERRSCAQCHVEQRGDPDFGPSSFAGLRFAARGPRMHPHAPPALPHPRHERQRCLTCHGEAGGSPLRSPHPERVSCLQCHVEQITDATFPGTTP